MHRKVKNYALVICLFMFLFVVLGGGLHLNPGGALLAAATGTPLVIYAFNRRSSVAFEREEIMQSDSPDKRLLGGEGRSPRDVTKSLEFSALTRSTAVAWSQEDHVL